MSAYPLFEILLLPLYKMRITASQLSRFIQTPDSFCHHDGVTTWKRFPPYWPSVGETQRSLVDTSYKMMTSSNGNISRVTGHLCGEFTVPGEFPAQRPVTRSFHVFFDLRLKPLSKQSWSWWFKTLSPPLYSANSRILYGLQIVFVC